MRDVFAVLSYVYLVKRWKKIQFDISRLTSNMNVCLYCMLSWGTVRHVLIFIDQTFDEFIRKFYDYYVNMVVEYLESNWFQFIH